MLYASVKVLVPVGFFSMHAGAGLNPAGDVVLEDSVLAELGVLADSDTADAGKAARHRTPAPIKVAASCRFRATAQLPQCCD